MKRTTLLWTGLLALALLPAVAQPPAKPTGKIHGHVTNSTGVTIDKGTISLSNDGGQTSKYTFPVNASGDYSGEAAPGTYTLIFRLPETPPGKLVDQIDNVKIIVNQDVQQDDDMSRKEFIDKLSPEEKRQLEEIKKKNAAAMQANEIIKGLNNDLKTAGQDFKDADGAHDAAVAAAGANAPKSEVDAKEAEIKTAKYSEVETLMLKDTAAKPDASILWAQLGTAQLGLARVKNDTDKYSEAETTFKKVLDVESTSKKPNPATQGLANAGLGEIYARTGKIPEANAAFDAAAKANPTQTVFYLKNEMVIFFQINNADAQVAAAEEVIKADPTVALAYYLKGNGLVGKATVDPKTNTLVAPPGCQEAYQKYLALDPNGKYAGDVKAILASLQATLPPTVSTKSGKKK
ncbi:MAG: carboxypeptidase-like regulatory domain-containing protein [Terracidiphilus sp.]